MNSKNPQKANRETPPAKPVRQVAVIDVGSSSVRMAIAEIDEHDQVHLLETVSHAVNLGKDTFTIGEIRRRTIEQCAGALRSCSRLLEEYGITQPERIRVVATSAIREASNRLAVLDRLCIATGLEVEPIDEAEVSRMTYLGIQPQLRSDTRLAESQSIVVEVGGGNTDLLYLNNDQVMFAHGLRLGALRLRESLRMHDRPLASERPVLVSQIRRTIEQAGPHIPQHENVEMVALGGDMRFAARELMPEWESDTLGRISIARLQELADSVISRSEDEIVRDYRVTFPDAETLGPALLVNLELARVFRLKHLYVSNLNMRDNLLREMASRESWTEAFREQIVRAAIDLGNKFNFDETHARHVANLARQLFEQLQPEHQLASRYELLVYVAGLLHEIGLVVSDRAMHKHTMYLIQNSELFGMSQKDMLLVALVARYHRRASPRPTHPGYSTLSRYDRILVTKLAAILRVAVALDDSRSQRIQTLQVERSGEKLVISLPGVEDLSLEQLAIKQNGNLFQETFGKAVLLRKLKH